MRKSRSACTNGLKENESASKRSFSVVLCSLTVSHLCCVLHIQSMDFMPVLVLRPCPCVETCADTSLHITLSQSQEVTMSEARLRGTDMLSAMEE